MACHSIGLAQSQRFAHLPGAPKLNLNPFSPGTLAFALVCMAAPATSKCPVSGFYQSQTLIFSCYGSQGSIGDSDNLVKQELDAGATESHTIPIYTDGLQVKLESPGNVEMSLMTADGEPVLEEGTLNKRYTVGSKTAIIQLSGSGGPTSKEMLTIDGPIPTDLTLQVRNLAGRVALVSFRYTYRPYGADARDTPQCRSGGEPFGCSRYSQLATRRAVNWWSEWMRTSYKDVDEAWKRLMGPHLIGNTLPYYRWCAVWFKWPSWSKAGAECAAAYKFVTRGGMEVEAHNVYRSNFDWVFRLPEIADFSNKCCGKLQQAFASVNSTWVSFQEQGFDDIATAVWKFCRDLVPSGLRAPEYFHYLDADGYGGVMPDDLAMCWEASYANSLVTPPLFTSPTAAGASAAGRGRGDDTGTDTKTGMIVAGVATGAVVAAAAGTGLAWTLSQKKPAGDAKGDASPSDAEPRIQARTDQAMRPPARLAGLPLASTWVDTEGKSSVFPSHPWGQCEKIEADAVGIYVSFRDGTHSEATYTGVANMWTRASPSVKAKTATGFLQHCTEVTFLHNDGMRSPIGWDMCSMKYAVSFQIRHVDSQGSHFGATQAGWNAARFALYCGEDDGFDLDLGEWTWLGLPTALALICICCLLGLLAVLCCQPRPKLTGMRGICGATVDTDRSWEADEEDGEEVPLLSERSVAPQTSSWPPVAVQQAPQVVEMIQQELTQPVFGPIQTDSSMDVPLDVIQPVFGPIVMEEQRRARVAGGTPPRVRYQEG